MEVEGAAHHERPVRADRRAVRVAEVKSRRRPLSPRAWCHVVDSATVEMNVNDLPDQVIGFGGTPFRRLELVYSRGDTPLALTEGVDDIRISPVCTIKGTMGTSQPRRNAKSNSICGSRAIIKAQEEHFAHAQTRHPQRSRDRSTHPEQRRLLHRRAGQISWGARKSSCPCELDYPEVARGPVFGPALLLRSVDRGSYSRLRVPASAPRLFAATDDAPRPPSSAWGSPRFRSHLRPRRLRR